MSDTEKSGAVLDEPTATTPAAQSGDTCASLGGDQPATTRLEESTTDQASQPDAQDQPQSDFAFGTSRGSGLARGKRKTITAPDAPAPQPNSNGYQPTAIEVITPKSEYSNPFTGETVVETPRQEELSQIETPKHEEPLIRTSPTSEESTAEPETSTTPNSSESSGETPTTQVQPKPELKILPPAQPNRSRQSWESPSEHPARRAAAAATDSEKTNNAATAEAPRSRSPRGSSEGRPTFQPERRSRSPRSDAGSEKPSREERPKREPRSEHGPRAAGSPTAKPTAKPQGFFGWLKSLFGGGNSKPSASGSKASGRSEQRHEGGPKRRSRGGRGRGTGNGPRSGSESFSGRRNGEKTAGEHASPSRGLDEQRDRPRNRSRGGRGGRGRSGPRSEGQQSGGAI
ncbi:hypothetical protein AXK12_03320 [Cephaloticoccus capnophilus]|uniref:Uncharacterized protein n=1 Tax=Cephaloticoccus capnophilus TaxID=1548208 RepID=A0A139SPH6_9BACT|nr:hypothetical protein [Cephaloticoccus capnophilus]KXU36414.1 hypothetical protein AXK12_03320 [Cephaloticoccus capnophilus]